MFFEELDEISSVNENNEPKTKFGYNKKIEDPYIPIAVFVDRDFPEEVKDKLFTIIDKLLSNKFTIRINADDIDFYNRIKDLSSKHIEAYVPWKGFHEIETKYYFNSETSKHIAMNNFPGWEKITDPVRAFLARNVRMLFGNRNNSIALCLITWSPDGAIKLHEITPKTGKASFIIKVAAKYGFPVINIQRNGMSEFIEKHFNLT